MWAESPDKQQTGCRVEPYHMFSGFMSNDVHVELEQTQSWRKTRIQSSKNEKSFTLIYLLYYGCYVDKSQNISRDVKCETLTKPPHHDGSAFTGDETFTLKINNKLELGLFSVRPEAYNGKYWDQLGLNIFRVCHCVQTLT